MASSHNTGSGHVDGSDGGDPGGCALGDGDSRGDAAGGDSDDSEIDVAGEGLEEANMTFFAVDNDTAGRIIRRMPLYEEIRIYVAWGRTMAEAQAVPGSAGHSIKHAFIQTENDNTYRWDTRRAS